MATLETIRRTVLDLPPPRNRRTSRRVCVISVHRETIPDVDTLIVAAGVLDGDPLSISTDGRSVFVPLQRPDVVVEDGIHRRSVGEHADGVPEIHEADLTGRDLEIFRAHVARMNSQRMDIAVVGGVLAERREPQDVGLVVSADGRSGTSGRIDLYLFVSDGRRSSVGGSVVAPLSTLRDLSRLDPGARLDAWHPDLLPPSTEMPADPSIVLMSILGDAMDRMATRLHEGSSEFLRRFADAMDARHDGQLRDLIAVMTTLARLGDGGIRAPSIGFLEAATIVLDGVEAERERVHMPDRDRSVGIAP